MADRWRRSVKPSAVLQSDRFCTDLGRRENNPNVFTLADCFNQSRGLASVCPHEVFHAVRDQNRLLLIAQTDATWYLFPFVLVAKDDRVASEPDRPLRGMNDSNASAHAATARSIHECLCVSASEIRSSSRLVWLVGQRHFRDETSVFLGIVLQIFMLDLPLGCMILFYQDRCLVLRVFSFGFSYGTFELSHCGVGNTLAV